MKPRATELGETEGQKDLFLAGSLSQIAATVRNELGRSQESGASSSSPMWVAGNEALGPLKTVFLSTLAGRWTGSGTAGPQTIILIWDADISNGNLTAVPQYWPWNIY